MKVIPFDRLIVPENRQRRTFDEKKLQDLAQSIRTKGLLHPPVVRPEGENYVLVAGERRSRAIRSLSEVNIPFTCDGITVSPNHFPVTLISELSSLDLREAELEENTHREDLSWQDQAAAIAELDELRRTQKAAQGIPHTARDTATEIAGHMALGSEITKVTEAVVVAQHLADPDVAKAKTQKEAVKIIKKKAEAEHRAKLAEQFDQSKSEHTALLGNSLDLLKGMPNGEFDCILTDPPYGINADQFGDMASTEHAYEDTEDYAMDCYRTLAREGFRVCKPQAHIYVFLDPRYWANISFEFTLHGWNVWPTPLIWNKLNGMLPKPEYGPRRTYEMILFATKGDRKVLKVGPDVITCPMVTDRDHGAQKPVPLYSELLSRSCYPGQSVLDAFSGSGTIFPAANKLRLKATGMEISPQYFQLGLSRLDEQESALDLSSFGLEP